MDTIEANAVADVLFKWRKAPLPVGSIKSLIGHTEPCSPFLSLLKVIFALDSNKIPPNKNFSQPNKDIRAISEKKIQVRSSNFLLLFYSFLSLYCILSAILATKTVLICG